MHYSAKCIHKINKEAISHMGQIFTTMNVNVDVKVCRLMKDEHILHEICYM